MNKNFCMLSCITFILTQIMFSQADSLISKQTMTDQKWQLYIDGAQNNIIKKNKTEHISDQRIASINHSSSSPVYKPEISQKPSTEWEKMPGPYGGNIRHFYKFEDSLFVTTDKEVFLYDDSEWKGLNFDWVWCQQINCFYRYNSQNMIISTDEGLKYTYDGGERWSTIITIDWETIVHSYYEIEPGVLLLATSNGICISRYTAEDFYPFQFELVSLEGYNVVSVMIDGQNNIWAGTDFGLLKAKYGEFDWYVMPLEEDWYTKILCDSNDVIYALSNYKVFKSEDSGDTWWFLDNVWLGDITFDRDQNLIITNTHQIACADNNGVVWASKIHEKSLTTSFPINDSEILVGTLGAGIMKYSIEHDTFSSFPNKGINASQIFDLLSLSNGDLLASTSADSIYLSSDYGATWKSVYYCWSVCMESSNNGSAYVAANGELIRSQDFGKTWERLNLDVSPYYVNDMDINDDETLICAGTSTGEIYVSTDLGKTFSKKRNSDYNFVEIIDIIDKTSFVFHLSNGSTYYSKDLGNSCIDITSSTPTPDDIETDDYQYIFLASEKSVFKSPDGTTWTSVLNADDHITHLGIDTYQNLYAATRWGRTYISSDHGNNWTLISEYCPNIAFYTFTANPDGYIFCGTSENGLFRYRTEIENRNLDSTATVSLNYPNPFANETRIVYNVHEDLFVEVKIFDILGRELETLVSSYKSKGEYCIVWKPTGYPNGTYIAKIQMGGETHSVKMLLFK